MKALNGDDLKLNFRQKLFLYFYCYPPPGKPVDYDAKNPIGGSDNLNMFEAAFGDDFANAIQGKVILDIGCGGGAQVISMVEAGAAKSIGVDYRPNYFEAQKYADTKGMAEKVSLTTDPVRNLGGNSVDVVASQNAFEHFQDPAAILADASYVLKPGGRFFITFSPPWLHPFGVHMFFMLKYPWAHFFFSEKTIMTVRKLYRTDKAERFEDTEGGLNQMTIRKFEDLVRNSSLEAKNIKLTPIKIFPDIFAKLPVAREFITSVVSAELVKPNQ